MKYYYNVTFSIFFHILICILFHYSSWFAAPETFLNIINVTNSCAIIVEIIIHVFMILWWIETQKNIILITFWNYVKILTDTSDQFNAYLLNNCTYFIFKNSYRLKHFELESVPLVKYSDFKRQENHPYLTNDLFEYAYINILLKIILTWIILNEGHIYNSKYFVWHGNTHPNNKDLKPCAAKHVFPSRLFTMNLIRAKDTFICIFHTSYKYKG